MAKERKKSSKLNLGTKEDFPTKDVFTISVESLNNLVGKTLPITITIRVEYLDSILSESPPIVVQNEEHNPVQYETFLKLQGDSITVRQLDEITAHPIVFTVFYKSGENEASVKMKSSTKGSKKQSEAKSSKTSGVKPQSEKSLPSQQGANTLGSANLDVLPLLCGEAVLKETLLLQDSMKKTGSEVTAWPNLARLDVRVAPAEGALEGVQKPCNIVCVTLGSLYNFSPELGNAAGCQVTTMLPLFGRDGDDVGKVSFTEGVITTTPLQDGESMKRWYSLAAFTGKSALSKYRFNFDLLELKNTLGLKYSELKNIIYGTEERLEWNLLRRCWLEDQAQEEFYKKLIKYRCWPLEFHFPTNKVTKEKQKQRSRSKEEIVPEKSENRFVAFLELTNLLFPGVTKTHLTSQLYTYVANDVKEKWGEEIFPAPVPPTPPPTPVSRAKSQKSQGTNVKTKASVKDKTGSRKTKEKIKKSIQSEQETAVEEEVAVPLVTQDGRPVFVTIEIELMHPLVKKKSEAEILQSAMDIVPPRLVPERTVISSHKVQMQYQECIESLVKLINVMYQDFYSFEDQNDDNNDKRFLMHLHRTGAYSKMSTTIHQVLMDYMKDKIGLPPIGSTEQEIQTYISDLYVKLVEEMNKVVDQVMEGHELAQEDAVPICSYKNLNHFAVEAMEQGIMEKAAEYFMKRISHSKGEVAQYWLDFGIFHVAQCDYEKAAECGYEALSIDIRHKDGLFFYALLAWLREDFQVAELFFQALTELYPRCYQAWICFHFFCRQIDNKEGSEIAYINGIKSFEDLQNQSIMQSKDQDYYLLSWCPGFEGDNSPFVSTTIFLLKLGFPEFAETCLARELLLQGQQTLTFLYYLAVSHYKQSRYEESLSHLEQALHIEWEDVRLWTLKGHNLYKLKKEVEAREAYQFVLNCEGVPRDLHLTYLRMGQFLLTEGDYLLAKQIFIESCQHTPTPLLWLGLGMALYMLEEFEKAEYSLNEANMLDPTVSDVWVLLALVNLKRCRFKLAKKCENEAIRLGLKDSSLSQELMSLKEKLAPCCT